MTLATVCPGPIFSANSRNAFRFDSRSCKPMANTSSTGLLIRSFTQSSFWNLSLPRAKSVESECSSLRSSVNDPIASTASRFELSNSFRTAADAFPASCVAFPSRSRRTPWTCLVATSTIDCANVSSKFREAWSRKPGTRARCLFTAPILASTGAYSREM